MRTTVMLNLRVKFIILYFNKQAVILCALFFLKNCNLIILTIENYKLQ